MQLLYILAAIAAIVGSATGATVSSLDFEEYAAASATTSATGGAIATDAATPSDGAPAYATSGISDAIEYSTISQREPLLVQPCNLNEPTVNECIRGLFQKIVPQLKYGLPELNMPSIDPYFYRRGIFRYTNDGLQGGLLIKNMNIEGISALQVNSVLANFTENATRFIIKLAVVIPKLQAAGQFKADVKFGGLRLVPKGPFNITIDNVRATILTDGRIERSTVGDRVQLNRLNANLSVGNAHIVANGIFSDRNLNAMILNLVNENLPEITRVGIPATREQWAPILVEHINGFFANVPIDKLLVQ